MSGVKITIRSYTSAREKCEKDAIIKRCRKRKEDDSWLNVVPSERVKLKQCDELSDEFKRVGIGLCFEGKTACSF